MRVAGCLLALFLAVPPPPPGDVFRSDTNLVLLRFSAMRGAQFVGDLTQEDIRVTEGGIPQKIALFESPLSATAEERITDFRILLDISGTMAPMHAITAKLLDETLLEAVRHRAVISIYAFAFNWQRLCGPTQDAAEVARGIAKSRSINLGQGLPRASRIYEAVVSIAAETQSLSRENRPVLVIISDGRDTSNGTPDRAITAARVAGMVVYPIVVGERDPWDSREYYGLGEATGGRGFWPPGYDPRHLKRIFTHIVLQAQAEYTVGYYAPTTSGKRKLRHVHVSLNQNRKDLMVYGGTRLVYR